MKTIDELRPVNRVQLTPTQLKFYNDEHPFVIGTGGVGCGKTFVACHKVFKYVMDNPGVRFLVGAYTYNQIKQVLMALLLDEVIHESYIEKTHMTDKTVKMKNGSLIMFKSLTDVGKLKGINLGGAYIDELTEIKREVVERVQANLRQRPHPCKIFATTNSDTYEHWVYKNFIDPSKHENGDLASVYNFRSIDNVFLPDAYLKNILRAKRERPEYYKIHYEGDWGSRKGLVYSFQETNLFNDPLHYSNFDRFIAGVDFGQTHPFAVVVLGMKEDRFYVVEEFKQPYLKYTECYEVLSGIEQRWGVSVYFCEHSPALIGDMIDLGLNAIPAPKGQHSVVPGIGKVRSLLFDQKLFVHETCEFLQKEFASYRYVTEKDSDFDAEESDIQYLEKPIKVNDDLLDALRYAIYGHFYEDGIWTLDDMKDVVQGI